MANRNTKTLEKELEKGLKEILLDMNEEEFTEYFKQLIKKYYKVLFTFENDYSKYYEDSNKQYEKTIQVVKDLTGFKYNNLDNFENLERLKQAEDIAFNQMNTIHFLESRYSDLIYYHIGLSLIYINNNLSSLIRLYEEEPSEALVGVIEESLTSTVSIVKQANKLPINEGSLTDYTENFTIKKEHFKAEKRPEEDVDFLAFNVPVFSLFFNEILEKFSSLLEDLKTILPEDVIDNFLADVNSSEKVEHYKSLVASGMEEKEAIKLTAFMVHLQQENNEGFLYEILDSWS